MLFCFDSSILKLLNHKAWINWTSASVLLFLSLASYQRKYPYKHIARTLCQPPMRAASETQYFFVDVSTLSSQGTNYLLRVSRVESFTLQWVLLITQPQELPLMTHSLMYPERCYVLNGFTAVADNFSSAWLQDRQEIHLHRVTVPASGKPITVLFHKYTQPTGWVWTVCRMTWREGEERTKCKQEGGTGGVVQCVYFLRVDSWSPTWLWRCVFICQICRYWGKFGVVVTESHPQDIHRARSRLRILRLKQGFTSEIKKPHSFSATKDFRLKLLY